jgi:hypothetical protein
VVRRWAYGSSRCFAGRPGSRNSSSARTKNTSSELHPKKQTPVPTPSGHGRPQILPHGRPAPWGKVLQLSKNGPALQCRAGRRSVPRGRPGFAATAKVPPSWREIRLSAATRPAVDPEKTNVLLKHRVYPYVFHIPQSSVKPLVGHSGTRRALFERYSPRGMLLSPSIESHSPQGIAHSPFSRGIPLI